MAEQSNPEARWQRVLERLEALTPTESPSQPENPEMTLRQDIRHLVRGVMAVPDDTISDEACRQLLPAYVEAELQGLDAAALYPAVKRHLELSPDLEEEYIALLEIGLAEERGELPNDLILPAAASLSFLPPLTEVPSLAEYVRSLVFDLARLRAPEWLDELEVISESFFRRIKALGNPVRLDARLAPTLGIESGDALSPLEMLATTYFATQALIYEGATTPPNNEALHKNAQQEAIQTAQLLGMQAGAARTLAEEYAHLVLRDPALLQLLIEAQR